MQESRGVRDVGYSIACKGRLRTCKLTVNAGRACGPGACCWHGRQIAYLVIHKVIHNQDNVRARCKCLTGHGLAQFRFFRPLLYTILSLSLSLSLIGIKERERKDRRWRWIRSYEKTYFRFTETYQ